LRAVAIGVWSLKDTHNNSTERRVLAMRKSLMTILVSTVCVLGLFCMDGFAAEKGPIKVGWLVPETGVYAVMGQDMTNGFRMYMEDIGYKVAGRKIEIIAEDSRAMSETAITKFRKLVSHDHVDVVAGIVTAPVGLACAALSDQLKTPLIISCAAADDNTQRKRKKWTTRTGWTGSQPMYPFGVWVRKHLGYTKVATIAIDFQFGFDNVGGFQTTFEANGGKIIQKQWAPIGTVDFGPYISAIDRSADAVFVNFGGQMCLNFHKQYQDAGIKIPLIGSGTDSDEYTLQSMGDEILGYISPLHYSAALDTPANRKFQEEYQKKYKKIGSYYADNSYESAEWLKLAIEAVKGDVENKEAFLKAIKSVRLTDPPRGSFHLDAYGNPIQNIYIRKVEKIKDYPLDYLNSGTMKWNVVIDTIPQVSQFWTFNPEEYMKQPTFSHEYPPCKYCK
jgi:branched-chain amino acid transport system substrate-binding protein